MSLFIPSGNGQGQIEDCPPAQVKKQDLVVMFLSKVSPDVFQVEYSPMTGEYTQILDDLTIVCNLTRHILESE